MNDYISREEAEKRIDEALSRVFVVPVGKPILSKIPAADVKPVVRGKWESHGEGFKWVYICSVCGFVDGHPMNDRMNYCPACGARMEE